MQPGLLLSSKRPVFQVAGELLPIPVWSLASRDEYWESLGMGVRRNKKKIFQIKISLIGPPCLWCVACPVVTMN